MNETNISWAHYSGSPHLICAKVSPGCVNCYAWLEAERKYGFVKRDAAGNIVSMGIIRRAYKNAGFEDWETRPVWGDGAPRVRAKGFWDAARKLNLKAKADGVRYRVFPSMIDWLDEMPAGIIDQEGNWIDKDAHLADLLALIHETPNLDWLLLTKRPENFFKRLRAAQAVVSDLDGAFQLETRENALWWMLENWLNSQEPDNVWIGTTVENQEYADKRIPELLKIPARVRFLSVEPQLGAVRLQRSCTLACPNKGLCIPWERGPERLIQDSTDGGQWVECACSRLNGIHWVICGGESGSKRRPFEIEWLESIVAQCDAAGVPVHVKQDAGLHPGKQGRVPDALWSRKEFPAPEPLSGIEV